MEILKNSEKRWLRYDFSAPEIHDLSMDLANKTQQFQTVSDEKKSVSSQFKSRLDSIQSDLNSLSNKVASGYEIREVECEVKYHKPEQGKKTIIRKDNNSKIIEKMTSEEWNLFNQEQEEVLV
jgi:predicted transposase YbfD/YdcC